MDLINSIITIISSLLGAFLGKQSLVNLFNFFQRRKLKKLINILETHSLFDKFDTAFKSEFILPDLKEIYFYTQTGIETNEKSIQKYIEFKNKLGEKYIWADIRRVNEHLDLQNEEIEIRLNKAKIIYSTVSFISFPLIILTGFVLLFLHSFESQSVIEIFKTTLSFLILPTICGYVLVATSTSIDIAKDMKKRLKNL